MDNQRWFQGLFLLFLSSYRPVGIFSISPYAFLDFLGLIKA